MSEQEQPYSEFYRQVSLPSADVLAVLVCRECGASVFDAADHNDWHLAIKSALVMLDRR